MSGIDDLLAGYDRFFQKNFEAEKNPIYQKLAQEGQSPKVMVISCSDSRVDPTLITHAEPGTLFVARNIASLVPSYADADRIDHGTIAVLEYAVCYLQVESIVLMGHSHCGGMNGLLNGLDDGIDPSFIPEWLSIGQEAKTAVLAQMPDASDEEKLKACTHKALSISLNNLMTYQWLKSAVDAGKLSLHSWYFDIDSGKLDRLEKIS
jgi:carbonic anhydrase